MDNKKFSEVRKKLNKTQKELAELLGTSLKAICSYEQGWRTIPTHAERQLFFLLARKADVGDTQKNCWEIIDCSDEQREKCPAWEFNSGKFCWFINGTICNNQTQTSWKEKIKICQECEVMADIIG